MTICDVVYRWARKQPGPVSATTTQGKEFKHLQLAILVAIHAVGVAVCSIALRADVSTGKRGCVGGTGAIPRQAPAGPPSKPGPKNSPNSSSRRHGNAKEAKFARDKARI